MGRNACFVMSLTQANTTQRGRHLLHGVGVARFEGLPVFLHDGPCRVQPLLPAVGLPAIPGRPRARVLPPQEVLSCHSCGISSPHHLDVNHSDTAAPFTAPLPKLRSSNNVWRIWWECTRRAAGSRKVICNIWCLLADVHQLCGSCSSATGRLQRQQQYLGTLCLARG